MRNGTGDRVGYDMGGLKRAHPKMSRAGSRNGRNKGKRR